MRELTFAKELCHVVAWRLCRERGFPGWYWLLKAACQFNRMAFARAKDERDWRQARIGNMSPFSPFALFTLGLRQTLWRDPVSALVLGLATGSHRGSVVWPPFIRTRRAPDHNDTLTIPIL